MKGTVNIEFMFALFVFLFTTAFITFVILNRLPGFHEEARVDHLRSVLFQTTELLVFNQGDPINWNSIRDDAPENIQRIGLSAGTPYDISDTKLKKLFEICKSRGYEYVKGRVLTDQTLDMIINASGIPPPNICQPAVLSENKNKVVIERDITVGQVTRRIIISVFG